MSENTIPKRLTDEYLMTEAIAQTGLNEWGDDDFRAPLKVLVESFENDHKPTDRERMYFVREYVDVLSNRLRIQNDFKRCPEILDVEVKRPLIIVGLPRTGTTLLHNLLAQDPSGRALMYWELNNPSPPPDVKTRHNDPRIEIIQKAMENFYKAKPELQKIHKMNPTGPEECSVFLKHTLMWEFVGGWRIDSYKAWALCQDFTPAYRYYRKVLKLLTWKCPGSPVVLKNPLHIVCLDALLNAFPDANIIWAHRNLAKVIPSFCSMYSHYVNENVMLDYSKDVLQLTGYFVNNAMKVRDRYNPARFFDMKYQDLIIDPLSAVRNIYSYFGYEYKPQMEENMKKWMAENPQNKHGVHRYSLEDFGLNIDQVKNVYKLYCERYDVSCKV